MLVIALPLLTMLLLALMVPLLAAHAADRTQDQFVGRLGDVARFAVLAESAIETDETATLESELQRYTEVYGGSVLVVDANREVVVAAGGGDAAAGGGEAAAGGGEAGAGGAGAATATDEAVTRALTGATTVPPGTAWPWRDEPMLVGSPVGRDAQVLGAVIVTAPTDGVRSDVTVRLALMGALALATLLLTVFGVIRPLVGWVLRPVHALDRTATRLSSGDMGARASETGPPELRELARSFNDMADSVEASQAQQRELVADAAHQLGNPLTALRLRVEGLASDGVDRDQVEPVLEETDRLSATVESLLHLSQVGATQVVAEPVDVAALVRHRCQMWDPVFAALEVRTPPSAVALASAEIVDTAMDALLDNAAKFAPGSPVLVSVQVAPAPAGEGGVPTVRVRVADGGPGLHPDDVAKVGARFFRGRAHQNVPGTGLGLAIVRARLADCGGDLEVGPASSPGANLADANPTGGLAVTLVLPAA